MLKILFNKQPQKYLNKVPDNVSDKLIKACNGLLTASGDIVKLKGTNYYRLKIEQYRIIFTYDKELEQILIEEINTRTNIKYRRYS
ncbi:MAG: addiction module toxin RelE [Firmicutes bacterium]|nr:addiction module toxin RelE [Bacillota bacterium]